MNIKNFSVLGYYEPGFFHLRINTDEEINDLNELATNKTTQQYFSTFLHEYVHFLQEITTTFGLVKAGLYIDLIKDIICSIRNNGQSEFKVPVKVSNTYNSLANEELQKIYRGEGKVENYAFYLGYTNRVINVTDKDGKILRAKKYFVSYSNKTGGRQEFHFGSTCLKEYVTHSIQKSHNSSVSHPDIPYLIAELIVLREYTPLSTNHLFIIALCDACLMSLHPAEMFFNVLEWMKRDSFIPETPKDVYDYFYKVVNFDDSASPINALQLFDKVKTYTLEQLKDSLKSEIFTPNYQWLEYIIEQGVSLRLHHPYFLTELVDTENKLTNLFYDIFRRLGTPFFTNARSKGGFIPPNNLSKLPDQPYQLLVFREVLKVFFGKKECSLYEFCLGRKDRDITNINCKNAPWLRANEDELCPLGQLWKTWGLVGKIPTP